MMMESSSTSREVLAQLNQLLERSGFESMTLSVPVDQDQSDVLESALVNLKTLNAKYDKHEAIQQIRCLMDKYNIQLDQLIDRHGIV